MSRDKLMQKAADESLKRYASDWADDDWDEAQPLRDAFIAGALWQSGSEQ